MNDESELVYSTGAGRIKPDPGRLISQQQPSPPRDGVVRVGRETQGRKGKGVTVVTGLPIYGDALEDLARTLKQKLGTGGTLVGNKVEIQGDKRDAIVAELTKLGYKVKRVGCLLFAVSALLFPACSSFFVSDTGGLSALDYDYTPHTVAQPLKSPKEEEYSETLKSDKLTVTDFLKYQALLLETMAGAALPGPNAPNTNQRSANMMDAEYDARALLDGILKSDTAITLLRLKNPVAEDAAALVGAGFPVLAFGTARYKHPLKQAKGMAISLSYDCFTLITGSQRFKADKFTGRYTLDKPGDQYAFDTREGFGVKAREKSPLQDLSLDMRLPPDGRGQWLFKAFFVVIPGGLDTTALPAGGRFHKGGYNEKLTGTYHYEMIQKDKSEDEENREEEQRRKEKEQQQNNLPPLPQQPMTVPY